MSSEPQTEAGKRALRMQEQTGAVISGVAILAIEAEARSSHSDVSALATALKESRDYINSHLGSHDRGYRMLERAVDAFLRSSHSDVSADLRAALAQAHSALHSGEACWPTGRFNELHRTIEAALAAPSARAEAAPEREGLVADAEAWEAVARHLEERAVMPKRPTQYRRGWHEAYGYAAKAVRARLAPTSPSSEETPE